VDGKEEVIRIEAGEGSTTATGNSASNSAMAKGKTYPRKERKEQEAISLLKLVDRVDGWARTLKLKDEGSA